jgi:hypothetical protein
MILFDPNNVKVDDINFLDHQLDLELNQEEIESTKTRIVDKFLLDADYAKFWCLKSQRNPKRELSQD